MCKDVLHGCIWLMFALTLSMITAKGLQQSVACVLAGFAKLVCAFPR